MTPVLYSVDEMMARDGRYVITTPSQLMAGQYAVCEVEAGICHQLTPENVRDGELSREGWAPDVLIVVEADLAQL